MRLCLSKHLRYYFCTPFQKYGISSRIGGSSAEGLYQIYAGKYENKALKKIKNKIMNANYGTTIITTEQECLKCVEKLKQVKNSVAWDTETVDLDVKNQSPVGKGKIICASFFAGPEFDFGNGPKVFIDNFGTNAGLLNYFKDYMEDEQYKKVWHNYGFDRHVFYNHGINVRGFAGDTMHMARLYDSSKVFGQYALSALTKEYRRGIQQIVERYLKNKTKQYNGYLQNKQLKLTQEQKAEYKNYVKNLKKYKNIHGESLRLQKVKMDSIFRRKKVLKSGQQGKTYQFPTTLTLHTKQQFIPKWIDYSVLDSQSTFFLKQALILALKNQKSQQYEGLTNIYQIYQKYWRPFGELLTDMQREGFKINMEHMRNIEKQAGQKIEQRRKQFMDFLITFQDDENIGYFNPSSHMQMQQLLHGPYKIDSKNNQAKQVVETDAELQQLKQSAEEEGEKRVVKRQQVLQLPAVRVFKVDNEDKERGKAKLDMSVRGLGIPPIRVTPNGLPSVDEESLSMLAGSPTKTGKYGKAYHHFKDIGEQQFGKQLCEALEILLDLRQTQTLLQTFIQPLQGYADKSDRIHCSLNINTQTGRLSSKKPNLQNQPALEKDVYKIRSAFTCEKGNKLIVADYGQLQLRVLAHLSNCKRMIQAFIEGGDFHSRTAIGMFDYIKKDIDEGKVLLEWDKSKGQAPAPLLKEKYAAERRKAKTVNFSIAYGKTAQGFADDWNCTIQEAKQVIKAWFKDRPQVEQWQKKKQQIAKKQMKTQTLLGRYRRLDKFFSPGSRKGSFFGMGLRRAINTPIQGGAADIVIAAMVKLHQNEELRKLGWKLLLQIHDELILQGPQSTVKQAFAIVKNTMSHPFQKDLLVELQVDAKIGQTWYECK